MKSPSAGVKPTGKQLQQFVIGERLFIGGGSESFVCMQRGGAELLLLKRYQAGPDLAKLLAAAEVSRRLQHENVCKVIESGPDNGGAFVVRQLAAGKDARGLVRRLVLKQQLIDEKTAFYIAHQVCLAIEHIHSCVKPGEPVRCDLSTRNIYLGYDGVVRLVDVLVPGDGVGIAADIRAVGACLHELLTGELVEGNIDAKRSKAGALLATAAVSGQLSDVRLKLAELSGGSQELSVSALVKEIFPRSRQTEEGWRRALRGGKSSEVEPIARSVTGPHLLARPTGPQQPVPRAGPPAIEIEATSPSAAEDASREAPRVVAGTVTNPDQHLFSPGETLVVRKGGSAAMLGFLFLVLLAAATLVYGGLKLSSPPSPVIAVRAQVPVKVSLDGKPGVPVPATLVTTPGAHRLALEFPTTGKTLVRDLVIKPRQRLVLDLTSSVR